MRGWIGKILGIAQVKLSRKQTVYDFGWGEIPDLAGRHSKESNVAVGKEFGMAEGNFITKNARSEVKKFATKI